MLKFYLYIFKVFKVVFSCHAADGCLEWTWWNDSLDTTIAWFNTPGLLYFGIEIR